VKHTDIFTSTGLTEVRRDGKDNLAVGKVIKAEFERRMTSSSGPGTKKKFVKRMREYAAACWSTMESMHNLFLDDDQPENEKVIIIKKATII